MKLNTDGITAGHSGSTAPERVGGRNDLRATGSRRVNDPLRIRSQPLVTLPFMHRIFIPEFTQRSMGKPTTRRAQQSQSYSLVGRSVSLGLGEADGDGDHQGRKTWGLGER